MTASEEVAGQLLRDLTRARLERDGVRAEAKSLVRGAQLVEAVAAAASQLSQMRGRGAGADATEAVSIRQSLLGVLEVGASYNVDWRRNQLEDIIDQTASVYASSLQTMAEAIVSRAEFEKREGESTADARVRFAEQVMSSRAWRELPREDQVELQLQLERAVGEVLSDGRSPKREDVLLVSAKVDEAVKQVAGMRTDVNRIEGAVSANIAAIRASHEATQRSFAALESKLGGKLDTLQAQSEQLQYMSFAQMPPAMQLRMLRDPSFLPGLPERETTMTNLSTSLAVQSASEFATGVGQAANLLVSMGVPINAASVNQGTSIVEGALGTYASVLSGNYLGALNAMGRLMGGIRGSGPDAGAMRHRQVMKALEDVAKMQRETLRKVDELKQQLTESTQTTLLALNSVYEVSTLAVRAGEEAVWRDALNACRTFYRGAYGAGVEGKPFYSTGKGFASYAARKAYFDARVETFERCLSLYSSAAGKLDPDSSSSSAVPYAYWDYRLPTGPAAGVQLESSWSYARNYYLPMYEAHVSMLLPEGVNGRCAERTLAHLAATPRTLFLARELSKPCDPATLNKATRDESPGLDTAVSPTTNLNFKRALGVPAHPERVLEVGELLLHVAPFLELRDAQGQGLLPESKLADAGYSPAKLEEQSMRYAYFADIATVALAQQAIFSGALIVDGAVRNLVGGNFGWDYQPALERRTAYHNVASEVLKASGQGAPEAWTSPAGTLMNTLPQEFSNEVVTTAAQQARLDAARASYVSQYLKKSVPESKGGAAEAQVVDYRGFCPVEQELKVPIVARRAAVFACLVDSHPSFARNVSLALFIGAWSQSVQRSGVDYRRDDVARWFAEGNLSMLQDVFRGIPLVKTGPSGEPKRWGARLLHPEGREIFLPAPSVAEMEQGMLGYAPTAFVLMRLKETLLDRSAALKTGVSVFPQVGDTSVRAQTLRRTWTRQTSHYHNTPPFR